MDIDFVILWVDGADPEHRKKRTYWQDKESGIDDYDPDPEQSTGDDRFIQSDELKYCLRSIKEHAPWYRKIWLITDNQVPAFLDPTLISQDRVEIVDHNTIFRGYEQYLPTFNTRAIITMIERIPGLSEYFIFGNDDTMFGNRASVDFFFDDRKPIIYGDWSSVGIRENSSIHLLGIIKGALLEGFDHKHFLMTSHGFYPFLKSQIVNLKEKHKTTFLNNIVYRFRHPSQFVFESLFNHYYLKYSNSIVADTTYMIHFSNELCRIGSIEKIDFLFSLIKSGERKVFCLNDFISLSNRYSDLVLYLDQLCGSPLQSEL